MAARRPPGRGSEPPQDAARPSSDGLRNDGTYLGEGERPSVNSALTREEATSRGLDSRQLAAQRGWDRYDGRAFRPPFEKGNLVAVRSGAYSPRLVRDAAQPIVALLVQELADEAPWLSSPLYALEIEAYTDAVAARRMLADDIVERRAAGKQVPLRTFEVLATLTNAAGRAADRLGLNPLGKARPRPSSPVLRSVRPPSPTWRRRDGRRRATGHSSKATARTRTSRHEGDRHHDRDRADRRGARAARRPRLPGDAHPSGQDGPRLAHAVAGQHVGRLAGHRGREGRQAGRGRAQGGPQPSDARADRLARSAGRRWRRDPHLDRPFMARRRGRSRSATAVGHVRPNRQEKAAQLLAERRVQILWASHGLIQGKVRGASGVHDVRWTRTGGWSCSCAADGECSHRVAIASVTVRSVRAPEQVP